MTRTSLALALVLALALLAPPSLAQEGSSAASRPEDVQTVQVGNLTLAHWVGTRTETGIPQGVGEAYLWFELLNATANTTVFLNVTTTTTSIAIPNGSVVLQAPRAANPAQLRIDIQNASQASSPTNATYAFSGEAYEEQNGTLVLLGPVSGQGSFEVSGTAEVPVAPAPGIPTWAYAAGALVLLGAIIAGGVVARQRAVRRKMNEAPRRSQVMREMELEKQLERAQQKDPEQAQQIQQEIRQQEQVRVKRRELQILEAKKADALKTMDLLRKRHETGGLTKLQFDNMMAKKQADLAKIEADIAQMEAEDAGGAAAS